MMRLVAVAGNSCLTVRFWMVSLTIFWLLAVRSGSKLFVDHFVFREQSCVDIDYWPNLIHANTRKTRRSGVNNYVIKQMVNGSACTIELECIWKFARHPRSLERLLTLLLCLVTSRVHHNSKVSRIRNEIKYGVTLHRSRWKATCLNLF